MTPVLSIHDYENTSIAITPAERQELLDIFEFRTKSRPPVLWTKFFDFHKKLLASTTTLTLTPPPDEWREITLFLEYRRKQYPSVYRKKDASVMAKLQANPPTPRNTAI